jgi:hypothetical protein
MGFLPSTQWSIMRNFWHPISKRLNFKMPLDGLTMKHTLIGLALYAFALDIVVGYKLIIIFIYYSSPCTLGLSFFCPYICISDALRYVRKRVYLVNQNTMNPRGLQVKLELSCSTSWVPFTIFNL